MGGQGSGRRSSPEDKALLARVRKSGALDPPAKAVDRAKSKGIKAIRKINANKARKR